MNADPAIRHALAAANLSGEIVGVHSLSGGCIHDVRRVELKDGRSFVAKLNRAEMISLFEEEAASLRALAATRTVVVPEPLAVIAPAGTGAAVLLMTMIHPAPGGRGGRGSDNAWRRFGEDLASLHAADAGTRYGFHADNHIGATPQVNAWSNDWVEFNANHRLGFQLSLARDRRLLEDREIKLMERVIERLDDLIQRRPKPSLLHGDLWSGNVMPTTSHDPDSHVTCHATCAVIDPACSIGDALADIAMLRLFGGIPESCFDSYLARFHHIDWSNRHEVGMRIAVYQLYHVMNHINLFGRGYGAQAISLAKSLTEL